MTQFNIRQGNASEVEQFPIFNEGNEGDTITVAEHEGKVVAFMQHTGAYVYFIGSDVKGAGTALVNWAKEEAGDYVCAVNVEQGSEGFWQKMGFEPVANSKDWDWYAE